MATILKLATLIGQRCGRSSEVPTFVLRAREANILPDSGRGGRGNVNAPAATTEHAVVLLLAMMQRDKDPRDAIAAIGTWAKFEPAEIAVYSIADLPNGGAARELLGHADTATLGNFAAGLMTTINLLRRRIAEPSTCVMIPHEVSLGSYAGVDRGTIKLQYRSPGEAPFERQFVYLAPGWETLQVPEGGDDVLSSLYSLGGGVLRAIAELLGPLAMTGGGGLRAGSAFAVEDDDALAALLDRVPIAAMTTPSDLRIN